MRDGLPAFAGNLFAGEYLRSQYDPSRDLSQLKAPNAQIASEGVVAAVLFWTATDWAIKEGAVPGAGLDQPGLQAAEERLVEALLALPDNGREPFRPDIVDLIAASGDSDSSARQSLVARFVDLTRGVTAEPTLQANWSKFYRSALALDQETLMPVFQSLDGARRDIRAAATSNPNILRLGLGPVIPVRIPRQQVRIVAFGEAFPVEFDLNAAGEAEFTLIGLSASKAEDICRERDRKPFASLGDFEKRTGFRPQRWGWSRFLFRSEVKDLRLVVLPRPPWARWDLNGTRARRPLDAARGRRGR